MRLIPLYIVLILTLCLVDSSYARTSVLNIIYTGDVSGELEPCGCSPKTDFGGMLRRGGYIEANRKALSPYVLVDAGNWLGKDTTQGRLKAEAMVRAFSEMDYDVVALMGKEQRFPSAFLSGLLKRHGLPFISSIKGAKRSYVMTRNGIRINFSVDFREFKRGTLNILLTDSKITDFKNTKGWDIIILSSGEIVEKPVRINGSIAVSGYPRGERLGILKVVVDEMGDVIEYNNRWQFLDNSIEGSSRIKEVMRDYNRKVATLLKGEYKLPGEKRYVGVSKCLRCHQQYVENWKATRHARAWEALLNVGKSNDPECIRCHVVGFGEEGGFHSIGTTPELSNVQCEVCHGPGAEHVRNNDRATKKVDKSTCLKCHTERRSPNFDYSTYINRVNHKNIWGDLDDN